MNFKKGHFVKLKDVKKHNFENAPICLSLLDEVNVFIITDIKGDAIRLDKCNDIVGFNDIEPIPINGVDDRWIYADIITLPHACLSSDSNPKIPIEKIDYSYYLSKKIMIDDKLIDKKFIEDNNIKYVHELQDYLHKEIKESPLKINYSKEK